MPISIQEIKDHYDRYGLNDLSLMSIEEYRQALSQEAFLWVDHHDFIRSTLSGEIYATNREQIDALIGFLKEQRDKMP